MSKIRSDLRVRTRGFTNVTSDSSYAADSYFTNKPSGSDSKFRSDFRHWTRAGEVGCNTTDFIMNFIIGYFQSQSFFMALYRYLCIIHYDFFDNHNISGKVS